ncbi:hypothetical protein [Billgrantia bachuensis]|uniref:Uncharacterized protein n=1 Tax=Billgrantia bachuensis TaxID=2717286 RepID=A0ABX0PSL5_9GAMM|nr:hypothetical protein [Halomonas bachuensis]NIC05233.1 hypothetical protein [Halomonas bachuensis]
MNAPLPTVATRNTSHGPDKDLIDRATRLAFLVEAAERRERKASRDRLLALIAYHETMAELTSRTTAWCDGAQQRIESARTDHCEKARAAKAELAQHEGGN